MNFIKKHPLATLITVWVLILVTAIGVFAAKAQATPGRWITTIMTWGPYQCIQFTVRLGGEVGTSCTGGYDKAVVFVPVNGTLGVDPIIGNNSWAGCSVSDANTGQVLWSDYGTAGDGHDINCLRVLNTGNVNA